jgi:hypothetical protein
MRFSILLYLYNYLSLTCAIFCVFGSGYCEISKALLLKGANVDALWVAGTKAQLHQSIYSKLKEGIMKDLWNHLAEDVCHSP